MMRRWNVAALRDRYYSGYNRFSAISRVVERATPDAHVLEIGCGDGRNSPDLRGRVALYAGIDTDPRVLGNSKLDDARIGRAERLPWPDQTFDIVFHHMVAEHLADPAAVMCETARVLKPGGMLVFETPNRWHYAMIAAAMTPHWFHERYLPLLSAKRESADIFPTLYRCNSRRQITRALDAAGLDGRITFIRRPPNYLGIHPATFMLGVLYERTVERMTPALRARILVEAVRPS
jgi:SAM-dependent methyltransferase